MTARGHIEEAERLLNAALRLPAAWQERTNLLLEAQTHLLLAEAKRTRRTSTRKDDS